MILLMTYLWTYWWSMYNFNFWKINDFKRIISSLRISYNVLWPYPLPSPPTLPRYTSFLYLTYFKSLKTSLCWPNILGDVVFHWSTVDLSRVTLRENYLSFSQKLTTVNSSMVISVTVCLTLLSRLRLGLMRVYTGFSNTVVNTEFICAAALLCPEDNNVLVIHCFCLIFFWSSLPQWSLSLAWGWGISIFVPFRNAILQISYSLYIGWL